MVAFQSNCFSPVLPLQSEKSGNVEGGSNPERASAAALAVGAVAADAGRFENLFSGIELQGRAGLGLGEGDGMHPHHGKD